MDPLTAWPDSLIAGDTTTVSRSYTDVPVGASWVVVWIATGTDGSQATVTATESAGAFLFTLSPAESAKLTPGTVTWAVTATLSGNRYTQEIGSVVVRPDPTNALTASTSQLAHIDRVIAACEAALEGRMTSDVQMYQLPDGVTVSKLSIREIRETLYTYRAKRASILRGGRLKIREVWYAYR